MGGLDKVKGDGSGLAVPTGLGTEVTAGGETGEGAAVAAGGFVGEVESGAGSKSISAHTALVTRISEAAIKANTLNRLMSGV